MDPNLQNILDSVLAVLGGINPMWAAIAGIVIVLLRSGVIKLPFKLPLLSPKAPAKPAAPAEPQDELEDHPLLDRLWKRIKNKFAERVDDGEEEDDVYADLVDRIRSEVIEDEDDD